MTHTCHAEGCNTEIPPRLFMCKKHWFALPLKNRVQINRYYRPGQEIDKRASQEYLQAAREARQALRAVQEGR